MFLIRLVPLICVGHSDCFALSMSDTTVVVSVSSSVNDSETNASLHLVELVLSVTGVDVCCRQKTDKGTEFLKTKRERIKLTASRISLYY